MPTSTQAVGHVRRHPLEALGRFGYAVKGALYLLLGALALDTALDGGATEGQTGALAAVAETAYGGVLLGVVAVGLAAYALWRLALAALDPEGEGSDPKGLARRAFYLVSAVSYATLAYSAYRILSGASGGADNGAEERTATLLQQPFGRVLVGALALGLLAYAAVEAYRASTAGFMDKLRLDGIAQARRATVRRIGQAGLAARAVVYVVIGGLLAVAAAQSDASEAGGLDDALRTLQQQPFGPILLGLTALGLAAYGLYGLLNARYRRYEGAQ